MTERLVEQWALFDLVKLEPGEYELRERSTGRVIAVYDYDGDIRAIETANDLIASL